MDALRNQVLPRPPREQEILVVVKFQTPQPRFRIFTMQRQTVDRVLKQFIADNANMVPIELKKLRYDPLPRGENIIQHTRRDKDALIKLINRSFVLKDGNSEDEMIEYISKVFTSNSCQTTYYHPSSVTVKDINAFRIRYIRVTDISAVFPEAASPSIALLSLDLEDTLFTTINKIALINRNLIFHQLTLPQSQVRIKLE